MAALRRWTKNAYAVVIKFVTQEGRIAIGTDTLDSYLEIGPAHSDPAESPASGTSTADSRECRRTSRRKVTSV